MNKSTIYLVVTYCVAGMLLYMLHTYGIMQAGFFDYDSARNWQIEQEIGRGNFRNLFHHASPTFFLYYALFIPFLKDFHQFIILNSLFNVAAILLFIRFVSLYVPLKLFEIGLLILFTGCSTFIVASSRYFTIEAPSLFLFTLFIYIYYKSFTFQNPRFLKQAVLVLAIGISVNYKLLLVIPIIIVLEVFHRGKPFKITHYIFAGLILAVPYLVYGVVAVAVDLPFYKLAAALIKINDFTTPTPGLRTGRFNFDFTYYFRYLWHFESLLLVPGILLFPVLFRKHIRTRQGSLSSMFYRYLFLITFLFLAGMHVLLKSPRGLLFCYALLYIMTFLTVKKVFRYQKIVILVIASSIFYQIWLLKKEIYTYTPTEYPKVIAYLQKQKISKLVTTVGLGITPFAAPVGIQVKTIFNENDLPRLREEGFTHVLLDDYYLAANIRQFSKLEKAVPIAQWREPSLLPPLLYLDQCEFSGLSFLQALRAQQEADQDSVQLRLIPINYKTTQKYFPINPNNL